ncbi:cell division/cell wall cluster transcriptional repressor MraZ [Rhodobacteraceae bacterium CCMM004]|nr:cell division/cell wall cluster transcriptional repressor MraZ [Rhodobacteraceae bacterium CCMM004]
MFGVFIGEHENKVDSKGRLSIPADFRRELERGDPAWDSGKNPSMAVVYGDERRNFLEVFTINDLKAVHAKIRRMPRGSRKRGELQRLYASQVLPATVDDTGRIVLAPRLREKLDLAGTAMVVGNGETFEIWKPETYRDGGATALAVDDDFDPALDPSVYLPGDDADGVF